MRIPVAVIDYFRLAPYCSCVIGLDRLAGRRMPEANPQNQSAIEDLAAVGVFFTMESIVPTDFIEFDLAVRSEIILPAAPEAVWDPLDRIKTWKDSVASVETIEGEPDTVGQVIRVGQRRGDKIVYVTHRKLVNHRPVWKVEYLQTEDGRSSRGYLVYSLFEQGPQTLLVCEVLIKGAVPETELGGQTTVAMIETIRLVTQQKLENDLKVLKHLIELGTFARAANT
ncbi:MAG: SRPBCC family protein [Lysobacterales bacterium]